MCETAVEYAPSYQIWWTVSLKKKVYVKCSCKCALSTVENQYVWKGKCEMKNNTAFRELKSCSENEAIKVLFAGYLQKSSLSSGNKIILNQAVKNYFILRCYVS